MIGPLLLSILRLPVIGIAGSEFCVGGLNHVHATPIRKGLPESKMRILGAICKEIFKEFLTFDLSHFIRPLWAADEAPWHSSASDI